MCCFNAPSDKTQNNFFFAPKLQRDTHERAGGARVRQT